MRWSVGSGTGAANVRGAGGEAEAAVVTGAGIAATLAAGVPGRVLGEWRVTTHVIALATAMIATAAAGISHRHREPPSRAADGRWVGPLGLLRGWIGAALGLRLWVPTRRSGGVCRPGRSGRGRSPSTAGSGRRGSFESALVRTSSRPATSGRSFDSGGGEAVRWRLPSVMPLRSKRLVMKNAEKTRAASGTHTPTYVIHNVGYP